MRRIIARHHPARQVDRPEQGLGRDPAHGRRRCHQLGQAQVRGLLVLHRGAVPDVGQRGQIGCAARLKVTAHPLGALGEHLEDVLLRAVHDAMDDVDPLVGHGLVEQIGMSAHEDHARPLPALGLVEPRLVEPHLARPHRPVRALLGQALARPVVFHPAAGEAHGVAVLAPAREHGAARDRIPGCVGPLDLARCLSHCRPPLVPALQRLSRK